MESGDRRHPQKQQSNTQKEQSKVISMVVDMETEDSLKRCAIMVITKKIQLAHADLLYYKSKNILLLLCSPMVLIYNSELGVIIIFLQNFFMQRNSGRNIVYTLVFLFYFLLRQFIFYLIFLLRQFIFYTHL